MLDPFEIVSVMFGANEPHGYVFARMWRWHFNKNGGLDGFMFPTYDEWFDRRFVIWSEPFPYPFVSRDMVGVEQGLVG